MTLYIDADACPVKDEAERVATRLRVRMAELGLNAADLAGVAADEILDPRPLAEILRQWSTVNPEFLYLPRKFKIALCAAQEDRAAVMMHDIGLYLYRDAAGELLLRVMVGGGLGRTPILGQQIREGDKVVIVFSDFSEKRKTNLFCFI